MKEAAEGLKRLRNDELLNFYAPSSIIRVMKWRRWWEGHVTRMGIWEMQKYFGCNTWSEDATRKTRE